MKRVAEPPTTSFAGLVDHAFGSLAPHGALEWPLPPAYAQPDNLRMTLRARFAQWPARGSFRSVFITNGKVEIVNMFFFPLPSIDAPLYAMEFVRFGPKGVVGVIDIASAGVSPSASAAGQHLLRQAHADHPLLVNGNDPPEWYETCRSGDDFFIRPESSAAFHELCAAHRRLWEAYTGLVATAPSLGLIERGQHERELAAYMDHHRIHSPGLPLLHRTFGEHWTDTFLREYLFSHDASSPLQSHG